MTYTLTIFGSVMRDEDQACIPADPRNKDWREYQEWLAEGNEPNPVPNPIFQPARIPLWALKAILDKNNLLSQADALVAASTDPVLKIYWANGNHADRVSPMLNSMATALGLTDAQIDQMFIDANALNI